MGNTLRILVVDDNPDDRALIKRELSCEFPRVQVTEVADAQGLALALTGEPFHLAITDYMLCWSNGLVILRDLKARWPETPVIMSTGTGREEVGDAVCLLDRDFRILQCNQAMADLVAKPFSEIVGHHCWELVYQTSGPIADSPIGTMKL